jgi:hypothetical protein
MIKIRTFEQTKNSIIDHVLIRSIRNIEHFKKGKINDKKLQKVQ